MEDFCVMKPDKGAPLGTPSMNLKFNEEYCSVIYIILTLVWDVSMYCITYEIKNKYKGINMKKILKNEIGNGML